MRSPSFAPSFLIGTHLAGALLSVGMALYRMGVPIVDDSFVHGPRSVPLLMLMAVAYAILGALLFARFRVALRIAQVVWSAGVVAGLAHVPYVNAAGSAFLVVLAFRASSREWFDRRLRHSSAGLPAPTGSA